MCHVYILDAIGCSLSKSHIKLNDIILYHFTKLRSIYVIIETFYGLYYVCIYLPISLYAYV